MYDGILLTGNIYNSNGNAGKLELKLETAKTESSTMQKRLLSQLTSQT